MTDTDTDRLIRRLAAESIAPVPRAGAALLRVQVLLAAAFGAAVVAAIVYFGMGWRVGESGLLSGAPFLLKLVIGIGLAAAGIQACCRLLEPGRRALSPAALVSVGLVPAAALAVIFLAGPASPVAALPAATGLACMLSIAALAIVPMAMLLLALRRGAPTRLRLAGLFVGLTGGAVTMIGFAFYCPLEGMGSILFWYAAALIACAGIGALVGPRVMAW